MITFIMDQSAFHFTWLIDWLFSLYNYVTIAQNPKWDQVRWFILLMKKLLNYRKSVIN